MLCYRLINSLVSARAAQKTLTRNFIPPVTYKVFARKNIFSKSFNVILMCDSLGQTNKMMLLLLSAAQETHKSGYFHLEEKSQVTWDMNPSFAQINFLACSGMDSVTQR